MDSLAKAVQAGVRPFVVNDVVPGMLVELITPEERRVLKYGRISKENPDPPDERTLFGIASVTKVFTSVALADMVWNGKVGLNDPVVRHLGLNARVPSKDGVEMKVLHLATHTSGLPVGRPGDGVFNQVRWYHPLFWKFLWKRFVLRQGREMYSSLTWQELYGPLSRAKLDHTPGTKWQYSNIGMGLLGHVMEKADKRPFEEVVLERVCRPLGLRNTAIAALEGTEWPVMYMKLGPFAAAGGMYSNGHDLAEFVAAAAGLKGASLRSVFAISLRIHGQDKEGKPLRLGWQTHPETERPYHLGGNHAFIGFDPKTSTGAVILCTGALDKLEPLGHAVLEVLAGGKGEFPKPRIAIELAPEKLAGYAGEYEMKGNDKPIVVTVDGKKLVAQFKKGGTAALWPQSDTEFFCREWDCQFVFKIEGGVIAGAMVSMYYFKGFYEKVN